ncbi:hypothetical protein A6R68_01114 [Neotoma lepida]|uniref:Histone H2A n=1 Tax=Neotoma lepida TaxID=56216 RepID=A0A1A6GXL8_NEOLE|nr:hypothetical protein A6R68_01114 [Neotoma lepida]
MVGNARSQSYTEFEGGEDLGFPGPDVAQLLMGRGASREKLPPFFPDEEELKRCYRELGYSFPVGYIHRHLKTHTTSHGHVGTTAAVYSATITEYLTAEVLEQAGLRSAEKPCFKLMPSVEMPSSEVSNTLFQSRTS